jgi:YD repeat-containing protein
LGFNSGRQQLDADATSPAVYNQARHIYDERDLLLRIEHSRGEGSNHQDRTFSYDGCGRLQSQNTPEGRTVSYTYKANDLVETATDARGITTSYDYNKRGLVTQIVYSDQTPDVFYDYGEYGERLWMQEYAGLLVKLSYTVAQWIKQIDYGYTYGLGLAGVGTDLIAGDPTGNIVNGLT